MALLISPMIVPLVITASGLFFFFSSVGLAKTYLGHHSGPCGFGHTVCDHHGHGHLCRALINL